MFSVVLLALATLNPPAISNQWDAQTTDELLALLNTPVTVASNSAKTVRESPGVVSLITREEIQASGARDLIDVLRLVPGFDFGKDVQGDTGPSIRGIWGYEGKILILWDGVEMNETLYGCARIDQHYPVDQIKRIEIIRGPGSAIYGGYSELAVIRITSLQAEDIKGVGAQALYGQGDGASYHASLQAMASHTWDGGKLTFGAFGGGNPVHSSGQYTDPYGASYEMRDNSQVRPAFFNLGLELKDFQLRAIVDDYYLKQRDNYDQAMPSAQILRESSVNIDARYVWKVSSSLTLTPYVLWRDQKPFWTDDPVTGYAMYQVNRRRGGLSAAWTVSPELAISAGAEGQSEKAHAVAPSYPFLDGSMDVSYTTKALFAQAEYSGPVNVTVGARWEDHSQAGSAFVPRLAITKAWGKWHLKGLFAYAYRTPSIMNLNQLLDTTKTTDPEKTHTVEVEGGVSLGSSILTLNVYTTKIDKPIVYSSGADSQGNLIKGYINQPSTGSKGVELEWKYRQTWGFVNAALSHYEADNQVSYWAVPGQDKQFLGSAPNKATLAAGIKFAANWTFGPSVVWLDERYGYTYSAAARGLALSKISSNCQIGGNLTWSQGPWNASLGLFDAGDTRIPAVQPYYGQGPLPGPGREAVLKVRYGF